MTTATLINGRQIVTAKCSGGCGIVLTVWAKPSQPVCCSDCRDKADRTANGWNKSNSRD